MSCQRSAFKYLNDWSLSKFVWSRQKTNQMIHTVSATNNHQHSDNIDCNSYEMFSLSYDLSRFHSNGGLPIYVFVHEDKKLKYNNCIV